MHRRPGQIAKRRIEDALRDPVSPEGTAELRGCENVIDAFFDLADAIITVRSLIRQAWVGYRWDGRPTRRP